MRKTTRIISMATLIASLGFVAMPAMAANATSGSCIQAAQKVRDALEKNQHSSHYDKARRLQRAGLEFCNAGMYKLGMSRYGAALSLLGADKSAATGQSNKS